ncbi:MAG: hypothetical protein L0216_20505, partial [Planctomycetales bacterium]|nr:hypothetical protein [Planctomycetales bacterium]
RWKGRTIAEVLGMTVGEALPFFEDQPGIRRALEVLDALGLGYLTLGQSSPTLSGGEAERVKLAAEMARAGRGRTLYVLDEPTTGLHLADAARLARVLRGLADRGDTVVVIEHNLEIVARADWVVDLGPEGGASGGRVVGEGHPLDVAKVRRGSFTAAELRRHFRRCGLVTGP